MNAPRQNSTDSTARRKGVARTAWVVGLVALGIYVAFILSGVLAA
jgi:hypothetical protein